KCELFSFTNGSPVGRVLQIKGATNWSFAETGLPLGHYYVQVVATNAAGQIAVLTNDFTAGLPFSVLLGGNGRGEVMANFAGRFLVGGQHYELEAVPSSGSVFDSWCDGVNYTNN